MLDLWVAFCQLPWVLPVACGIAAYFVLVFAVKGGE